MAKKNRWGNYWSEKKEIKFKIHGKRVCGLYSTDKSWLVDVLNKNEVNLEDLTFEDIWQIHLGSFLMGNSTFPVKEDSEWNKYVNINKKRYYDYNDVKDDPIKSKHIYKATKLTLFIWDISSESWWHDGIYMMIKDNGWAYDNYRAKMNKNTISKDGRPEFFLWARIKRDTFKQKEFNKVGSSEDFWMIADNINNKIDGDEEIAVTSELVKKYIDWDANSREIEAILNAQKTDPWFSDFLNDIKNSD